MLQNRLSLPQSLALVFGKSHDLFPLPRPPPRFFFKLRRHFGNLHLTTKCQLKLASRRREKFIANQIRNMTWYEKEKKAKVNGDCLKIPYEYMYKYILYLYIPIYLPIPRKLRSSEWYLKYEVKTLCWTGMYNYLHIFLSVDCIYKLYSAHIL